MKEEAQCIRNHPIKFYSRMCSTAFSPVQHSIPPPPRIYLACGPLGCWTEENAAERILEMKFSDINLTKDSSLFLHATNSPFYWRILKKTILFSGFKYPYEKSTKQDKIKQIVSSHHNRRLKNLRNKRSTENKAKLTRQKHQKPVRQTQHKTPEATQNAKTQTSTSNAIQYAKKQQKLPKRKPVRQTQHKMPEATQNAKTQTNTSNATQDARSNTKCQEPNQYVKRSTRCQKQHKMPKSKPIYKTQHKTPEST